MAAYADYFRGRKNITGSPFNSRVLAPDSAGGWNPFRGPRPIQFGFGAGSAGGITNSPPMAPPQVGPGSFLPPTPLTAGSVGYQQPALSPAPDWPVVRIGGIPYYQRPGTTGGGRAVVPVSAFAGRQPVRPPYWPQYTPTYPNSPSARGSVLY